MDLQTENQIAAILMKEAAELRRQAEQEGVLAYLRQPKARFRPNSRFITATVRGVQQANRAVEVDEMWRVRKKEKELDIRLKGKTKDESTNDRSSWEPNSSRSSCKSHALTDESASPTSSSRKREYERCGSREENGLRDEELEEFLHSRVKRGRGAVGPRMDEPGPYLARCPDSKEEPVSSSLQERRVYGPAKPSQRLCDSSEDELDDCMKKSKKVRSGSSKNEHSKKHKSKDKSKDKKKRRKEEKRSRYYT